MSAQELRKAAETLRERAVAATAGPWEAWSGSSAGGGEYITSAPRGETFGITPHLSGEAGQKVANSDATYIATMHPGVGLALADLLDHHADDHGSYECDGMKQCPSATVARLINGGAE